MFTAIASRYDAHRYHVMGPDGEIRLANVPLKDALKLAALLETGLLQDHPPVRCPHKQRLDAPCSECWYYD